MFHQGIVQLNLHFLIYDQTKKIFPSLKNNHIGTGQFTETIYLFIVALDGFLNILSLPNNEN